MVGVQGFEPWTPCSQSRCATRLRYTPTEPIFYTEMATTGKSCKIAGMRALFLSRLNKQFRGWIALSFLLASLLGTHWIGFAHGIAHSGIQHQNIELSCADQEPTLGHSSVNCHLLDALILQALLPLHQPVFLALIQLVIPSRHRLIHPQPNFILGFINPGLRPPSFCKSLY